ncbi:hypothetical protein AOLI_G00152460 [Acnodon oligacanthus]
MEASGQRQADEGSLKAEMTQRASRQGQVDESRLKALLKQRASGRGQAQSSPETEGESPTTLIISSSLCDGPLQSDPPYNSILTY